MRRLNVASSIAHTTSDAWLGETSRRRCTGCVPNVFRPISSATWTDLIFGTEACLNSLASHGGGYLVLNVDRPDDPFVQFVVDVLGFVEAEAASTVVAEEGQAWRLVDSSTEHRLLRIGWHPPDADPLRLAEPAEHPNFHRSWPGEIGYPPALFAELGVRTLAEAFEVNKAALVRVRGGYLASGEFPSRI